jgi:hypothetical protein
MALRVRRYRAYTGAHVVMPALMHAACNCSGVSCCMLGNSGAGGCCSGCGMCCPQHVRLHLWCKYCVRRCARCIMFAGMVVCCTCMVCPLVWWLVTRACTWWLHSARCAQPCCSVAHWAPCIAAPLLLRTALPVHVVLAVPVLPALQQQRTLAACAQRSKAFAWWCPLVCGGWLCVHAVAALLRYALASGCG